MATTMALFGISEQVKRAFDNAKEDMDGLKKSMNSWILHLNSNQADMKRKLYELDQRVRELEMEKVREMIKG